MEACFVEGSLADVEGPFDLVVANLYAELHAHLAEAYREAFGVCGLLIVTGILAERERMVGVAKPCSFRLLEREQEGEWVCLTWAAV